MIITNMKPEHIDQIVQLEKLCFADPWDEKSVAYELTNPLALWLVAEEKGVVAGYIGSQTCIDETDMMNVAVHPDFRRRGIAGNLVSALIEALKEKGSLRLTLEVRESNAGAIALYDSLGFAQVGLRKNYYRHPKENALILRKEWER